MWPLGDTKLISVFVLKNIFQRSKRNFVTLHDHVISSISLLNKLSEPLLLPSPVIVMLL